MTPMISPSKGSSQPRSYSSASSSHARQMSSARYSTSAAARSRSDVCSASSPRSGGTGSPGQVQLAQQRAMDDEVGVAADRRGEMAVGGARETGVAEVARVVAGLLQRPEYERREGLPPPPRLPGELGDELTRLRRKRRGVGRREVVRRGRRRHLQIGE